MALLGSRASDDVQGAPGATAGRSGTADLLPITMLPVALIATALGLLPLWHRQAVLAGATTLVVTVLIITGLALRTQPLQAVPGAGLVLAGPLLELSWINEWGSGPLPMLSLLEGHAWLFLVGWALYRYPGPRLGRLERRAFQAITVWVLTWPWALILTSRPSWRGYPADAWWPSVWPNRTLHAWVGGVVDVTAIAALAVYIALWLTRWNRAPAARRQAVLPSTVGAVIGAGCAALVPIADVAAVPAHVVDILDAVATTGVLALPGALLVVVVRRHLARSRLAALLPGLRNATSIDESVRALRHTLGDDPVVIEIWSEPVQRYLDTTGDDAAAGCGTPGEPLVRRIVTSSTGDPLARISAAPTSAVDPELFEAVAAAFGLSLENARLLERQQRQLVDLRELSARAVTAAQTERSRLQRDLHDGAQARFLALAPLIGAAQARTVDPLTSRALDEIRVGLRGALAELRRLALGADDEGIDAGLRVAVEELAGVCPVPVRVDLPGRLLSPLIEKTAYLVVCEALANALKHSGCREVTIVGRVEEGSLTVRVSDDGCGGATTGEGSRGGLAGLRDRARTVGGDVTIDSPVDSGTSITLTVDVECE